MGAFMIFDISFESKKDRKRFEEKYEIKKKDILVDENVKCGIFAWVILRNPKLEPIYFMNDMGYGEPKIMLRECLKEQIKIKFLAWVPINDRNSNWEKIRGRWE